VRQGGNKIQVTLSGSKKFRGFLIQGQGARGNFVSQANLLPIGCSETQGATIRHRNSDDKKSITAVWEGESAQHVNNVKFTGTVVENIYQFYELPQTGV